MPILTVTAIKAAKPIDSRDRFLPDGNGLFLKVAANGSKSYVFRYTYGSRRRLMTLGTYPALDLAKARQKHLEARQTLKSGADPLQINHAVQQAFKGALNVEQLGDEWLRRVIDRQFKKPEEVRRMLITDIYPRIGKYLAKDITSREAALVVNKVVDRGSPVQANRVLRTLKKLFAYAVEQSHVTENPVTMTIKGAGGREEPRKRNLTLDEIMTILQLFETSSSRTSWQVRAIIKLLVLTAQRSGEVCGMEWKHLSLDRRIWIIPKEITKSDRSHVVHLSPQAIQILRNVEPLTGSERYVFTSDKDISRHIETRSLSQAVRKRLADTELSSIVPFTPHDLRRTAASRMADMEVPPYIIEKILNHVMVGAMGIYNRGEYIEEREQALEKWGAFVEKLVVKSASDGVKSSTKALL